MQEQLIDEILDKFRDFKDFKKLTSVGHFSTYDLNYDTDTTGMRMLERFSEGEYRIGPLKVTRKYIDIGCFLDDYKAGNGDKYTLYTKVENTEMAQIC